MPEVSSQPPLRLTGHKYLKQRLIIATLTGRSIRISNIRSSSTTNPGLLPHEVSFLRLLDTVTNGSHIEFSVTGTTLVYKPGLITGSAAGLGATTNGGVIRFEVSAECTRGISWFLVPLCLLAPFSKQKFNVLLTGPGVITSSTRNGDISVDTVRTAILPLYKQFGIENDIELRILRRSCASAGGRGAGGEVQLVFGHQVRLPKTVHLLNSGRIKRVRGVAYAVDVAGSNNARMIEEARGLLNPLVSDTYIFSDVSSAPQEQNASGSKRKTGLGFGLSLVAETSTGALYSADVVSPPQGGETPEELGRQCAYQLLEVVSKGGCVSSLGASTMLTLMAMGSEDVGRLQIGQDVLASEDLLMLARDLTMFGAKAWGLKDAGDGNIAVSVYGSGVGNVGRKIA